MAQTIGTAISRVRNTLKLVKDDPFITDRYIYSLLLKYAKTILNRDSKLMSFFYNTSLFKTLPCIDLIEVDKIEACCSGISTGCTIKRSKDKLPSITSLNDGLVIRSVATLDYSTVVNKTDPGVYANMTKTSGFKYNKNKYYWIINSYLYIPDVEWESVAVQAMFEGDVSKYQCSDDCVPVCISEQERDFDIPEHIFSEIEMLVKQEMMHSAQIPSDGPDDNKNIMR